MSRFQVFGGEDRVPGISTELNTFENEFLFGTYYRQERVGLLIDGSGRDTGNTGQTDILRAGLILGLVRSSNKLKQWDPTETDGSEYPFGILKESRVVTARGDNVDRMTGPIMVAGGLQASRIIVPDQTDPGIVGNANEFLLRELLNPRFIFDDTLETSSQEYVIHTVSAAEQTSGITLTGANNRRAYHSTGAVTITLPTTPSKGLKWRFYGAGAAITVSSGSANIVVPGSSAASSLAVNNVYRELIGDGTNWIVLQL